LVIYLTREDFSSAKANPNQPRHRVSRPNALSLCVFQFPFHLPTRKLMGLQSKKKLKFPNLESRVYDSTVCSSSFISVNLLLHLDQTHYIAARLFSIRGAKSNNKRTEKNSIALKSGKIKNIVAPPA